MTASRRHSTGHIAGQLFRLILCLTAAVIVGPGVCRAQTPPPTSTAASASTLASDLARWVDVQAFQLQTRYHFVEPATSAPNTDQMQTWDTLRLRVKADPAGRVAVSVGWLSGPQFIGSWNDTGIGTGTMRLHTSLRWLSLDATPIAGVTAQVGSLQLARGESTEFTTFDNDGYLTGERITVHRPQMLYFDDVIVSRGYVGDALKPSVFDRRHRLADVNYRQYLVTKHVAKPIWTSADVTRYAEATIVHAAARVLTPTLRVVDNVRYEQYVRDSKQDTVAGFTATAEKQLTRPLSLAAGYGVIDKNYGSLNADRFGRGRRVYAIFTYALSPMLSVSTYTGRAVLNDYPVSNRTRMDVTLTYNVLAHLQRAGVLASH